MKFFSAQYVFTGTGPPKKRAIITTDDDGTILSVEDTDGNLPERHSLNFYNGIIVPGFVNSHCHLELSYLKDEIPERNGLGNFLMAVNGKRNDDKYDIPASIKDGDAEMHREGIVLCLDICNSSNTFSIKKESRIKYISLLEVFGIDSLKAGKRMDEANGLASLAEKDNLPWEIVPHSLYSVSVPLFRLLDEATSSNRIISIHFLESEDEISFLRDHAGPIMESYSRFLPPLSGLETVPSHLSAIRNLSNKSGNLILVHNTFIERHHLELLKPDKRIYYCLCPNSNRFIEGKIPPARLLYEEGCEIVIGTDSLSSNHRLSMLSEIRTIQDHFPDIPLDIIIRWATVNGARALGEESWAGTIAPGKKPGLVLIRNADLVNMKILSGSTAQRLI